MKYERWEVSEQIINKTTTAFAAGRHEVFVLWTAPLKSAEKICSIKRHIVPIQRPGTSTWGGVYVHIEGSELSRIQFDNYDKSERCVVQLHTHPSKNVLMSALDREWEVVKHVGALSIIVPNYGINGLHNFSGVAVYEREVNDWRLLSNNEVNRRLRIIK